MRNIVVVGALVGCQPVAPEMPWLYGIDNAVSSTTAPVRSPADAPEGDCGAAASRSIELVADIAPARGTETIVASYSGGIAVFDREDRLLLETSGYSCEGSLDELEVIAIGDAHGRRVLAIAATTGGHRETITWLSLFRTGTTLEPTFTAVVEKRVDRRVERGWVYMLPDGLVYKRPGGDPRLWTLDPGTQMYIPPLPELPHDEPYNSVPPIIQREMTSESNSVPSAALAWSTSWSTPTSR